MKKANFTSTVDLVLKKFTCLLFLIALCSFSSKIHAQNTTCSLSCNSSVQISVDQNCQAEIFLSTVLKGESSCSAGDFEIIIKHGSQEVAQGDFVGSPEPSFLWETAGDFIKKEVYITIRDKNSGNSCWGSALVEDKLPPVLMCGADITVACCEVGAFVPPVFEDCSGLDGAPEILSETVDTDCDNISPMFVKVVTRTYIARDKCGNVSDPCTIQLFVKRLNENLVTDGSNTSLQSSALKCAPSYQVITPVDDSEEIEDYDNWTESGGGIVSSSDFPNSLSITGDNATPGGSNTDVCFTASADKLLHFSWSASIPGAAASFNNDEPAYTIFNPMTSTTTEVELATTGNTASGDVWVNILAGGEFCFRVKSPNSAAETTLVISDLACKPLELPAVHCDEIAPECDVDGDGFPDPTSECAGLPFIDKTMLPADLVPDNAETGSVVFLTPLNVPSAEVNEDLLKHCGIGANLEEIVFPVSAGNCVRKLMRVWTVNEWYCGREYEWTCQQIIEVIDDEGPVVLEPAHDFSATTNGYTCEGTVFVPSVTFTDNCSDVARVDIEWCSIDENGMSTPLGSVQNFNAASGQFIQLPVGTNQVKYIAYDECHNIGRDTLMVTVSDNTPPVAICDDETVVSLTYDGQAEVAAHVFDDGSYDDCGVKKMLVRRMADDQPCDCETTVPVFPDMHYLGAYTDPDTGEDHHYYLSKDKFSGLKSNRLSVAMGGYAAQITSEEENDWLNGEVNTLKGAEPYYIGLNDVDHEGVFEWENGGTFSATMDFNPWAPAAPASGVSRLSQDYVWVNGLDLWDDVDGDLNLAHYVMELEDPCGFSGYTRFCCEDLVDNNHMVVFRVVDQWGNFNDCMVEVEVQDKFSPIIECPPDITVDCEFHFTDINDFGEVVEGSDNRESIVIPSEFLIAPLTGSGSSVLWDGFAHDNCSVEVIEDPMTDNRDQCGQGNIVRNFKAFTPGTVGDTVRCKQKITFQRQGNFLIESVEYPRDTVINECINLDIDSRISLDPEVFGEPEFVEGKCDLVGTTFDDQVFYFNDSQGDACFKVIRTWTVIDWCQVNGAQTTSVYQNSDPQIFKINNLVDPVLTTSCDPLTQCTFDNECTDGFIELIMTAEDDCTSDENLSWTYSVDAFSDGTFDIVQSGSGATADASGEYPVGNHVIRWKFLDRCGNTVTCDQEFSIVNCKSPTPYCITALTVDLMPVDNDGDGTVDEGMVVIWASDFTTGEKKHPCIDDDQIIYSFSPDTSDTHMTFTCCEADDFVSLEIYHTVEFPNGEIAQAFCTAILNVQDNMNACENFDFNTCPSGGDDGMGNTATISGVVLTEQNDVVPNVEVKLDGSDLLPAMTDNNGEYAFGAMPTGGEYTVNPRNDDDPMNGITTLDLVIIQKHILNIKSFDTAYKYIAADINKDREVSAADLVELRRLILGVQSTFVNNESWRFLSEDYNFFNPSNPLAENFDEQYIIDDLSDDMNVNFKGIKVGDLNYSVSTNDSQSTTVRSEQAVAMHIDIAEVEAGTVVNVPVTVSSEESLIGMQFTMEYDTDRFDFVGIQSAAISISDANYGTQLVSEGKISFSWHLAEATKYAANADLFEIQLIAKQNTTTHNAIALSSAVTAAEAYSNATSISDIELSYRNGNIVEIPFTLYQNTPNPFKESTMIAFDLPAAEQATVRIYDMAGKTVYSTTRAFDKGYNTVVIKKDMVPASGILYYALETESYNATKKMIVLK